VEPGREYVREHGQVADLRHRLVLVRELEQVPVGVGDHHVLGLAADPAAHVHVAIGGTRPLGVHIEADAGLSLLAVAAPAAGDVEGHRAEVALLDDLDVPTDLDDLARDLVAEDQALGGRGAAPNHVLVAAADVGGDDLEDDPLVAPAAHVVRMHPRPVFQHELGVVDGVDLNLPRADVGNGLVSRHDAPPLAPCLQPE